MIEQTEKEISEYTKEEVQQKYESALESAELIANGKPEYMSPKRWENKLDRNKRHIEGLLKKDFWTDQDLTPLEDAVK